MELRDLGTSGIRVSPLGLGTVKLGRNQGVKYPESFEIPGDREVRGLLELARSLGVNLLDTAPAYGDSEARLGRLLPGPREDWVIVSKVGESFVGGESLFDFSAGATRRSVERSLRRLGSDYLDVVLIHSDGEDLRILEREEVLETLFRLKQEGLLRALGMSTKTLAGGLRAVELCDLVMVTCSPAYRQEIPVLVAAEERGKGVLIKKALQSGHAVGKLGVEQSLRFVFGQPGVTSVIIGTINPGHLRHNVSAAEAILEREL